MKQTFQCLICSYYDRLEMTWLLDNVTVAAAMIWLKQFLHAGFLFMLLWLRKNHIQLYLLQPAAVGLLNKNDEHVMFHISCQTLTVHMEPKYSDVHCNSKQQKS